MLITLNLTTKNFCSEKLKYEIKFSALASVLKNVQTTQTHSYTSCSEDSFSMEHGLCSWKSKNCQSLYHCKHAKVKTCQYLKNQSPKTFVLCQKYISNHGKNKSLKCCWVFFFFFSHSILFPYLGSLRIALLPHQFITTSFESCVMVTPLESSRFSSHCSYGIYATDSDKVDKLIEKLQGLTLLCHLWDELTSLRCQWWTLVLFDLLFKNICACLVSELLLLTFYRHAHFSVISTSKVGAGKVK